MYKDCASIAKCNGTTEQWKVKMSFCSCTALCLLRCWVRANNQSIVDWRLIRAAGPDVTHRNSPIFSLSPKLEWKKLLKFTNLARTRVTLLSKIGTFGLKKFSLTSQIRKLEWIIVPFSWSCSHPINFSTHLLMLIETQNLIDG